MTRVSWWIGFLAIAAVSANGGPRVPTQINPESASTTYLGFDRNEYPGDENLGLLHRTFSFAGYWLNAPPGATGNTWVGHRKAIEAAGFGFLVLFNGRLDVELKRVPDAAALGNSDAANAVAAAQHEGFPKNTIIFLDEEEGGRMLPEQMAYIHAWVDGVTRSGFRAGIYCSGIAGPAGAGGPVITAEDIRQNAGEREIVFWVVNDACPPSPGCGFPRHPPAPARSGVAFAEAWQFAQSPKRRDVARGCSNYDPDGRCYAPGARDSHLFVDLNSARSSDPSAGRSGSR